MCIQYGQTIFDTSLPQIRLRVCMRVVALQAGSSALGNAGGFFMPGVPAGG